MFFPVDKFDGQSYRRMSCAKTGAMPLQTRGQVVGMTHVERVVSASEDVHPGHSTTMPSSGVKLQRLERSRLEGSKHDCGASPSTRPVASLRAPLDSPVRAGLPRGSPRKRANRVVRKKGLEPSWACAH